LVIIRLSGVFTALGAGVEVGFGLWHVIRNNFQ